MRRQINKESTAADCCASHVPKFRRLMQNAIVLRVAVFVFLIAPTVLSAQVFDQREQDLVSGLRDRSMFDLAEMHCQSVLERDDLTPTDYASIAVERIRVQTSQARIAQQRETHWQSVDEIAREFLVQHPKNSKSVLVGLQQALAHIAFANQLEQEVKARIGSVDVKRQQGVEQLTAARTVLERTKRMTMETIKAQANRTLSEDMLTSEQLRSLRTNLEYQQAIVNLTSAQLVDVSTKEGKLDQLDSLGRVPEQLGSVRSSVAKSRPLWWKTWIREATCRRLLGDYAPALKILKSLDLRSRPKSVNSIWMRERIELAMAMGNRNDMQRVANAAIKQRHDPETEVALIRLFVELDQVESASRLRGKIALNHGAWWARRADVALLSRKKTSSGSSKTVDAAGARMLFETAEQAERNGDLDAATTGFQSVAETQFSSGDASGGLATSVRAAMVLEKQGKHTEAAKVLVTPSKAHPDEKLAASIHLRGCWNLSKADDPQFLAESKWHISQWPESDSANQSRFWLASKQIARKEFREAFDNLCGTKSTSLHFPANVKLARYACRKLLGESESKNQSLRPVIRQLMQQWKEVYDGCDVNSRPAVAVAMAELALGWKGEGLESARSRMENVEGQGTAKSSAEFQYLLAIVSSPRKARSIVADAGKLPYDPSTVVSMLRLFDRMDPDIGLEAKLAIVNDLLARNKDAKLRNSLTFSKAKSLAGLGKKSEALAILKKVVQADPKNQKALVSLAELSEGSEALKLWRSIAARSPAQSPVWFTAKYNVAKGLHESGKSSEAAKMLRYIKAVPPGWNNSELKPKFETLLKACGRN